MEVLHFCIRSMKFISLSLYVTFHPFSITSFKPSLPIHLLSNLKTPFDLYPPVCNVAKMGRWCDPIIRRYFTCECLNILCHFSFPNTLSNRQHTVPSLRLSRQESLFPKQGNSSIPQFLIIELKGTKELADLICPSFSRGCRQFRWKYQSWTKVLSDMSLSSWVSTKHSPWT